MDQPWPFSKSPGQQNLPRGGVLPGLALDQRAAALRRPGNLHQPGGLRQPCPGPGFDPDPPGEEAPLQAPDRVDIQPTPTKDPSPARRHSGGDRVVVNPQVEVQEGVVFLSGRTESEDYKTWAGNLARNTQDVAAVVNQIEIIQPSIWDIGPAVSGLRGLWTGLLRATPLIVFSLLILVVTFFAARFSVAATRASLQARLPSPLLLRSAARAVGLVVFLIGLYVILQVAGLTGVALTVMGGTGLLGLVLGIAFQNITENFLASIFLSAQSPFHTGDLVDIGGNTGFVQALTTRVTVIMTQDGNHVQIPNATVYKSVIKNYTSNPNRRLEFTIGIGYEDSISGAQEVALDVLEEHPAVLKAPEPWVLVESLGSATVNLRVYFWIDGTQHSWLKVRSSVIRLVKRAFLNASISMPDEAREILFPEGIQVRMLAAQEGEVAAEPGARLPAPEESASVATHAEGGLHSDAGEIEEQARHSRPPEEGENLLNPSGPDAN